MSIKRCEMKGYCLGSQVGVCLVVGGGFEGWFEWV